MKKEEVTKEEARKKNTGMKSPPKRRSGQQRERERERRCLAKIKVDRTAPAGRTPGFFGRATRWTRGGKVSGWVDARKAKSSGWRKEGGGGGSSIRNCRARTLYTCCRDAAKKINGGREMGAQVPASESILVVLLRIFSLIIFQNIPLN